MPSPLLSTCDPTRRPRRPRLHRLAALTLAAAAASVLATACSGSHPPKEPAPTASPAPANPSKSASPRPKPADFSLFAGHRTAHGRWIEISQDGSFEVGARVYRTCDAAPAPCDSVSNGSITDGYHASGRLTGVDGTTATGEVTESNGAQWLPTGSVTVTLNPAADSISVAGAVYCSPNTPQHVC
ncbi:hypothetical protein AB0I68_26880 [Streptomyces sp. NPDC050448]|uniref:hypothetical protein n=1 Tax=Streptomyces sp. NPDC050448 TaxID=3155404 RepID=UPI003413A2B8